MEQYYYVLYFYGNYCHGECNGKMFVLDGDTYELIGNDVKITMNDKIYYTPNDEPIKLWMYQSLPDEDDVASIAIYKITPRGIFINSQNVIDMEVEPENIYHIFEITELYEDIQDAYFMLMLCLKAAGCRCIQPLKYYLCSEN